MASSNFQTYDRNLRRIYWLCFIDDQLNSGKRDTFKASLVVNAHTGRPIEPERPDEQETGLGFAAAASG